MKGKTDDKFTFPTASRPYSHNIVSVYHFFHNMSDLSGVYFDPFWRLCGWLCKNNDFKWKHGLHIEDLSVIKLQRLQKKRKKKNVCFIYYFQYSIFITYFKTCNIFQPVTAKMTYFPFCNPLMQIQEDVLIKSTIYFWKTLETNFLWGTQLRWTIHIYINIDVLFFPKDSHY